MEFCDAIQVMETVINRSTSNSESNQIFLPYKLKPLLKSKGGHRAQDCRSSEIISPERIQLIPSNFLEEPHMVDFLKKTVITTVLVQINQTTEFQLLYSLLASSLQVYQQKKFKNQSDNAESSIACLKHNQKPKIIFA